MKGWMQRNRWYLAAVATFVAGMGAAAFVYLTAGEPPEETLGLDAETSKAYLRALEMFGGKANVAAAELMQWFQSLWHGKRLGVTLAVISVIVSGALLLVAESFNSDGE